MAYLTRKSIATNWLNNYFSEERLILEPRNVAREIAAFLSEGDEVTVHFDRDVKQLPPGHHLFAGQTR